MRLAISGASGLVGSALCEAIERRGDIPVRLVRRHAESENEIEWAPAEGRLDPVALEGCDAVVNLSGESVAGGRWTAARKQRILDSRLDSTTTLSRAMASMDVKPDVFVSASAMGYYGDTGALVVDEESPKGEGFLADVCEAWEAATESAEAAGIRTVHYRIGLVLSSEGGALAQMLPVFKLGGGGRLGSGRQYMSWIDIDDLVAGILHCIDSEDLSGPVNAVAPEPVTNAEFTRVLANALHRPALVPVPAFGLRLALGDMADEMLLGGARIRPARLLDSDFSFEHATLPEALQDILG